MCPTTRMVRAKRRAWTGPQVESETLTKVLRQQARREEARQRHGQAHHGRSRGRVEQVLGDFAGLVVWLQRCHMRVPIRGKGGTISGPLVRRKLQGGADPRIVGVHAVGGFVVERSVNLLVDGDCRVVKGGDNPKLGIGVEGVVTV